MRTLLLAGLITYTLSSCNPFVNKFNSKIQKGDVEIDEKIHPKNSLEWWYLTGFLDGDNGKRYGIEYVFFHFRATDNRQRYMVNTAITSSEDSIFIYDYDINFSKQALNRSSPLSFNTGNYELTGEKGKYSVHSKMSRHNAGYDLNTLPTQPIVYHQDSGYVQYGDIAKAGYYSYPRLKTDGLLFINGDTINVKGTTWYDRQWNGGEVYKKNVAWDWTAINLSDGSELMLYRVNQAKGKKINFGGTYIKKDHSVINLESKDIKFEPSKFWKSSETKKEYPIEWIIDIEKIGLKSTMKAEIPNQELVIKNFFQSVIYWEGMCKLKGTKNGQTITGESYLEMTNR